MSKDFLNSINLLCEEKDVIIPIYVNSISTGSNDDKPIVILNSNKSNTEDKLFITYLKEHVVNLCVKKSSRKG